jgi:hypothetical protein
MLDISNCAKQRHSRAMDHKVITLIKWLFLAIGLLLLAGAIFVDPEAKLALTIRSSRWRHLRGPRGQAGSGHDRVIFAGIGGGIIAFGRWSAQKEADLRQNGQLIEAEFQEVEQNGSIEVNGEHPYRIVARWHDTANNRLHVFRSANLWFDPTDYVQEWIPGLHRPEQSEALSHGNVVPAQAAVTPR